MAALCGCALASALLSGCEPPPPEALIAATPDSAPFSVVATNVEESVLPAGEDLVVRFSRPVDADSVGPRSVSVSSHDRRRRLSGASVRVRGDEIRLPARLVRALVGDGVAELRVEGGASPCAVRSADRAVLHERYLLVFRIDATRSSDLAGPSLVGSRPADGLEDAAPSALIELRFSEALAVGSAPDGITVLADGVPVPARVRPSSDRRRWLVRPLQPFEPGAQVEVRLLRGLSDEAGNRLDPSSPTRLGFRVRPALRHEIEEDFASDEYVDRLATDCRWGDEEAPGVLVPRSGTTPLPCLDLEPSADLGDRDEVRFQVLLHGDEIAGGVGAALRLRFASVPAAGAVRRIRVEGGPTDEESLEPWLQANRDLARLAILCDRDEPCPWFADGSGGGFVDVPFSEPLLLLRGMPILLDVTAELEPGARLAAAPDLTGRALLRSSRRERLVPAAVLLVSGAEPAARSLWYDAGVRSPRWLASTLELAAGGGDGRVVAEFQTAPEDAAGLPDVSMASSWESDLSRVPPWRFVRFRVRFERAGWDERMPLVDRIAMPFERPR